LNWVLKELDRGWGKRLSPSPAPGVDLDRPIGDSWLKGKDSHMRFLASQSLARSRLGKGMLPELIHSLNDPEPINRVFHARAVAAIRGRPLLRTEFERTAPPAVRARQIEKLLQENAGR
jgi:hypothetical protein